MAVVASCPRCGATVPARGERGTCAACGQALRFVDVPDRPCPRCGAAVPLVPGQAVARCPACHRGMATDGGAAVGVAHCPRCRRRLRVGLDDAAGVCPWCDEPFSLSDAPDRLS